MKNNPLSRDPNDYRVNHKVKSHPESFQAVWSGDKGHEIRLNDRGYRVAHIVRQLEFDPVRKIFLGRAVDLIITHLRFAEGEGEIISAGLRPGYVVFDFLLLNHFRKEDFPESSATETFLTSPPFTTLPNPED